MEWINEPEVVEPIDARSMCIIILCMLKPCSPVACAGKGFP